MKKIFQVTVLTAFYTFLKMIAGFIVGKIVAIYTGPAGIAMLGQLQSLITLSTGITTAPVSTGLVRYTAESWKGDAAVCAPWWRACIKISGMAMLLVIPLIIVFSRPLAIEVFENGAYAWVVVFASCLLPFTTLNTLISSVLNGQQKYKQFILLGMLSVVISTIVMILLVVFFGLNGALIAAAMNSGIAGIVLMISCLKQPWFRLKYWWGETEKQHLTSIAKYALMALATAAAMPVVMIFIRKILIAHTGWDGAGHWQAVWKISEVYLGVITIALSTYFLPRLSVLQDSILIKREVNSVMPYIAMVTLVLAGGIYLFRDLSITLLFTEEFRTARDLFAWQLIGDVIKIIGFMYAYPLQAQGHTKVFIVSELLFAALFVVLCNYFVAIYGVQGANFAYAMTYSAYTIFAFVFTNYINVRVRANR